MKWNCFALLTLPLFISVASASEFKPTHQLRCTLYRIQQVAGALIQFEVITQQAQDLGPSVDSSTGKVVGQGLKMVGRVDRIEWSSDILMKNSGQGRVHLKLKPEPLPNSSDQNGFAAANWIRFKTSLLTRADHCFSVVLAETPLSQDKTQVSFNPARATPEGESILSLATRGHTLECRLAQVGEPNSGSQQLCLGTLED